MVPATMAAAATATTAKMAAAATATTARMAAAATATTATMAAAATATTVTMAAVMTILPAAGPHTSSTAGIMLTRRHHHDIGGRVPFILLISTATTAHNSSYDYPFCRHLWQQHHPRRHHHDIGGRVFLFFYSDIGGDHNSSYDYLFHRLPASTATTSAAPASSRHWGQSTFYSF